MTRFISSAQRFAITLLTMLSLLSLAGCRVSHHPTESAVLGRPGDFAQLRALIEEPGPVSFERVVVADWSVARSGLINLDHPRAKAAGLEDAAEPIKIYLYALDHPNFGTFLVDSGVESGFRSPDGNPRVAALVEVAMNTQALVVHTTTSEWLSKQAQPLAGVFLTHLHLDHVMGLPDVPGSTPIYVGPGETESSAFLNLFSRGTIDRMLAQAGPLREWQFERDDNMPFAGLVDVFGDASVWAIHTPGHTPGHTAFLVRATDGPKLLVGDVSHTKWGWQNDVEPGTFTSDHALNAESLHALRALSRAFPAIEVHLGHQALSAE